MSAHPEDRCQDCDGPNVVWRAPNEVWNEIMTRVDKSNPRGEGVIVCPRCFALRAERSGFLAVWELTPQ